MNKLPCEVVRDLFPSYVEKLTSEKTNACIEAHLESCEDCRRALGALTGDELRELNPEERAEIDFLKMQRRRTRRTVLLSILGVIMLGFAALGVKLFLIGSERQEIACDIRVDGTQLELSAQLVDSALALRSLDATEEDGIVRLRVTGVLVGLYRSGAGQRTFTFDNKIREVWLGKRVLWADGAAISYLASELYSMRNPYVGDMSANVRIAGMLDLPGYFGSYDNELSTEQEPYGWTFRLAAGQRGGSERLALLERDMKDYGCLLLATVKNLGWVRYRYVVDGKTAELTVTQQDADSFFGQSVKDCYDNVRLLDALVQKTGADRRMYMALPDDEELCFALVLNVPEAITGVELAVYRGERLLTEQGAENADGAPFREGESVYFGLTERDVGGFENVEELSLRFTLQFLDGTSKTVRQPLPVSEALGSIGVLFLCRDENGEYVIEQ